MAKYVSVWGDKVVSATLQVPDGWTTDKVVTKWQKASIHYQCHGTLPSVSFQVVEAGNIVDALVKGR